MFGTFVSIAMLSVIVGANTDNISCTFPEGNYKTINYAAKQTLSPVIMGD